MLKHSNHLWWGNIIQNINDMTSDVRWDIIYALEEIKEQAHFRVNTANSKAINNLLELVLFDESDEPKGSQKQWQTLTDP